MAMPCMPSYDFNFSGYSVWLLISNDQVQAAINQFNHTPFVAHCTVLYGVDCTEAAAGAAFRKLTERIGTSGWELYTEGGLLVEDYLPMHMRCMWVDYRHSEQLEKLRAEAVELFGVVDAAAHSTGQAHCSVVYDNAGSQWTDDQTAARCMKNWPNILQQHRVSALALVSTEGKMKDWRVIDKHDLVDSAPL